MWNKKSAKPAMPNGASNSHFGCLYGSSGIARSWQGQDMAGYNDIVVIAAFEPGMYLSAYLYWSLITPAVTLLQEGLS